PALDAGRHVDRSGPQRRRRRTEDGTHLVGLNAGLTSEVVPGDRELRPGHQAVAHLSRRTGRDDRDVERRRLDLDAWRNLRGARPEDVIEALKTDDLAVRPLGLEVPLVEDHAAVAGVGRPLLDIGVLAGGVAVEARLE